MLDAICDAPVRLALFCAVLGVVLGAVTIGPLDALVMAPATVAAVAVVLAAALVGRRLGFRGQDVVCGRHAEHEASDHEGDDVAERHGASGATDRGEG